MNVQAVSGDNQGLEHASYHGFHNSRGFTYASYHGPYTLAKPLTIYHTWPLEPIKLLDTIHAFSVCADVQ
jgi:hypothetical protein